MYDEFQKYVFLFKLISLRILSSIPSLQNTCKSYDRLNSFTDKFNHSHYFNFS